MPASAYFVDVLNRERQYVLLRQKTPKEAAWAIQDATNAEIKRVRTLLERAAS